MAACPTSAAAGRGTPTAPATPAGTKYKTYVQHGPGYVAPEQQMQLLNKKIELLTQKVRLLSQGRTDLPSTKAIDNQLAEVSTQLTAPK